MTKALVVETNGRTHTTEIDGFDALRSAVGGWIEGIAGENDHGVWTGYCDEEGKIKGLPVNEAATALAGRAGWYGRGVDVLCGPVVFFGPVDDEGDETDVTNAVLAFTDLDPTKGA